MVDDFCRSGRRKAPWLNSFDRDGLRQYGTGGDRLVFFGLVFLGRTRVDVLVAEPRHDLLFLLRWIVMLGVATSRGNFSAVQLLADLVWTNWGGGEAALRRQ